MSKKIIPYKQEATSSSREKDIISVTIGPPKVLNNTIYLADYDPAWPVIFARLAQAISCFKTTNT